MSDSFTREISNRICSHMNEDHADAVLLYAQKFGSYSNSTAAKMLSIDAQGMNLTVEVSGESLPIRIEFDHTLKDAEDAHHTLIDMLKLARTQK
ncbi:MAG: DUF2470 domain-containing protein [Okeania sp. SIO3B5]|uniref:DUF2470 domain-containing protein n=1 Tax=Okeania sp. SIO3B5 TaxID=2607811 RepID=UPI001400E13A|nr:DUF2470 domain-containing protein [Okeania sp. SIO3B5]NEO56440.1 DUF2470 domain-containing protein [Okeania sp. SIO3B5]